MGKPSQLTDENNLAARLDAKRQAKSARACRPARNADLPAELAAWAREIGATVTIDPDGFVLVEGTTWLRRYDSLDALQRGCW